MSTGIIENDQVRILTGPLQGMEGYIRKNQQTQKKSLGFHRNVWKERGYGGWAGNNKKKYEKKKGETKEGVCIEKNQEDGINTRTLYFLDLVCLLLSLILAYLVRKWFCRNIFELGIYHNMIFFVILADLFLIIIFESYKAAF